MKPINLQEVIHYKWTYRWTELHNAMGFENRRVWNSEMRNRMANAYGPIVQQLFNRETFHPLTMS